MNQTYTTLGEGRSTAVLFDTGNGSHRKVTTTDHETARKLTWSLDRAYSTVSNALWDVAVAYDGKPADARRRLLGVFDRAVAGNPASDDSECWTRADELIIAVARDVAEQPAAVVAAVRRELADVALAGLDGILVGGVLWAECYRPSYLRLILNPQMGDWTTGDDKRASSPFFDGLDGDALALAASRVDPAIGVPTGYLLADDTWMVLDLLRDLRSCHDEDYGEGIAASLFADSGQESPSLTVVVTHLRAWMRANRPDLLAVYPQVGA